MTGTLIDHTRCTAEFDDRSFARQLPATCGSRMRAHAASWLSTALAFMSLALMATPLQAQLAYTNTTFLNGFASDSTIWTTSYSDISTTPPSYLGQAVVLRTVDYANVNDSLTYTQQLARLAPFFVSGTQHVLVGHSLGSLVARGLYINYPGIQPEITGIVAVAGPHQGAPIVDNFVTAQHFLVDMQRRVNDALNAAAVVFPVAFALGGTLLGPATFGPGTGIAGYILGVLLDSQNPGSQNIGLDSLWKLQHAPAFADLSPSSSTIQMLNANAADAAIPHANIYGYIPRRSAALRIAASYQNNDAELTELVSRKDKGISLFKFCKYVGYATIVLSKKARQCAYGVKVLERLDDRWALYVNGTTSTSILNDGIVPNNRVTYPVGTNLRYNTSVDLANHLNIYKTRNGLNQVAQGMLRIGMSSTAPPPPPPGFTASISGPSTVSLCGGAWFASGANGATPYSYVWTVRGQTFNTGASNELDYAPSYYGSMTISLTVTDAQAHTATTSKSVTVSQSGMC